MQAHIEKCHYDIEEVELFASGHYKLGALIAWVQLHRYGAKGALTSQ